MEETGLGWAGWIGGVAGGIAGVLSFIITIIIWLTPSRRDIANDITNDPTYRRDLAADLASNSLGQHYHYRLESGLALLDRTFGPPSSAAALGTCIAIALVYAYAGFSVIWALGGPGSIVGLPLLPEASAPSARILASIYALALPVGALWLGYRLQSHLKRLEGHILILLYWVGARRGLSKLNFIYHLGSSTVVFLLLSALILILGDITRGINAGILIGILPVIGVFAGTLVRPRFANALFGCLTSILAGSSAVVGTILAYLIISASGAGQLAGVFVLFVITSFVGPAALLIPLGSAAFCIAVVSYGASLGSDIAVVGATIHIFELVIELLGPQYLPLAISVENSIVGTLVIAVAVAFASVVAGAIGLFLRAGAFPGGLGTILAIAVIGIAVGPGFTDEWALILVIFFLVLPLINGVVDWVSWWVTRWLGAHLLRSFGPGATARRLSSLAIAHGLADLLLAAFMLLAMAFTLALGFEVYNQASLWQVGEQAFDLETFVAQAAAAPFSDGAWLTLMLLTTLVPTFLHVVVVCMSPLGFLFLSARRHEWAKNLAAWDTLDEPTQSRTRRAVAGWMAYGRIFLWLAAGLLALGLFTIIAMVIALLHDGGFADYVADAAFLGITLARWLAGN